MIEATILILALPLYIIIRVLSVWFTKKNTNWLMEITLMLFFIYILVLVGVSLFPVMIDKMYAPFGLSRISVSVVPFLELSNKISQYNGSTFVKLLIVLKSAGGNFVLLMPFGFFYPILLTDKKGIYFKYYAGLLLILSIEFAQLVQTSYGYNFSKVVNTTDMMINIIGFVVGYTISHKLIEKKKIHRLINRYDFTIREVEEMDESS